LAGATGLIGSHQLSALLLQPHCDRITVLSRRALDRREAFARVDHDDVMALARATLAAGSRQFLLVSAAGSSLKSPSFYSRTKSFVERDLRATSRLPPKRSRTK
jgi:uncharacterized protein YbjT (DUF2867 family)